MVMIPRINQKQRLIGAVFWGRVGGKSSVSSNLRTDARTPPLYQRVIMASLEAVRILRALPRLDLPE